MAAKSTRVSWNFALDTAWTDRADTLLASPGPDRRKNLIKKTHRIDYSICKSEKVIVQFGLYAMRRGASKIILVGSVAIRLLRLKAQFASKVR